MQVAPSEGHDPDGCHSQTGRGHEDGRGRGHRRAGQPGEVVEGRRDQHGVRPREHRAERVEQVGQDGKRHRQCDGEPGSRPNASTEIPVKSVTRGSVPASGLVTCTTVTRASTSCAPAHRPDPQATTRMVAARRA